MAFNKAKQISETENRIKNQLMEQGVL